MSSTKPNEIREQLLEATHRAHDRPGGRERCLLDSEIVDALLPFVTTKRGEIHREAFAKALARVIQVVRSDCGVLLNEADSWQEAMEKLVYNLESITTEQSEEALRERDNRMHDAAIEEAAKEMDRRSILTWEARAIRALKRVA